MDDSVEDSERLQGRGLQETQDTGDPNSGEVEFSIIIPTHNRAQLLLKLLERLANLDGPAREVIVIDDASPDRIGETVRERFPDVRVVRNEVSQGFDALPQAVEMARGRYLVQLDDDAYPDANALVLVQEHFERRGPQLGVVAMSFVDPASGRTGYSTYIPKVPPESTYAPAGGFFAGAVAVRREAAREVPPSPPGYFMYETEVPATIEYLLNGWEVDYLPAARVFHLYEARSKPSRRQAFLSLRNDIVTINRYFQGWRRAEMLAGRYLTGLLHLAAAGGFADVARARSEAWQMLRGDDFMERPLPPDLVARIYPSFDGLTFMTLFGEANRRRVAWFLGRLPVDQTA